MKNSDSMPIALRDNRENAAKQTKLWLNTVLPWLNRKEIQPHELCHDGTQWRREKKGKKKITTTPLKKHGTYVLGIVERQ